MKCLLIVMLCALVVTGCIGPVLKAFQTENPNATIVAIDDEPKDGVIDAYGADDDGDGESDREVPGSRERFEQAGFLDENIELLLGTLVTFGIPGTLIGKYWGKIKPMKRLAHTEGMFNGVVGSVQKVRESGKIDAATLAVINQILREAQGEIIGIKEAIAKAKETNT